MASFPEDQLNGIVAKLKELQMAAPPQPMGLAEILQIEDAETMCAEYCQFAQNRLYDPNEYQVSRFEIVANLVDRCHYYLVSGGISSVLDHHQELADFVNALTEVGATRTATTLSRVMNLVSQAQKSSLPDCLNLTDMEDAVAGEELDTLASEIDREESWHALVRYLEGNRSRLGGSLSSHL